MVILLPVPPDRGSEMVGRWYQALAICSQQE
jgi:hypothetical protein